MAGHFVLIFCPPASFTLYFTISDKQKKTSLLQQNIIYKSVLKIIKCM